jgi:gas vesicle protein
MSQEELVPRSGFKIFAIGAVIGAGLALLYAPQSGKETRKLLAKKARLLRDKAQLTIENAQEIIKDGKANLASAFDSAKEIATHKRS